MLEKIQDLPAHVFGVRATEEVTGEDLKNVLHPGLEELSSRYGEIHYLLVLSTPVKNFTATAWFQDMLAGLKHFSQWKKMAIVTEEEGVLHFTDTVSPIMPGETKGFPHAEIADAIAWVSERSPKTEKKRNFPIKNFAIVIFGVLLASSLLKKGINRLKQKYKS